MRRIEAAMETAAPATSPRLRLLKKRIQRDAALRLMSRLARPGSAAVDLGANRGAYTLHLARCVGRRGAVHAVEPLPDNLPYLRALARGRPEVHVYPVAASDAPGTTSLFVPRHAGETQHALATLTHPPAVAHEKLEVQTIPLDELLADERRPVAFIKCDVEGHEPQVLAGARATLREHRPALLIEIEQRHRADDIRATFAELSELGYEGQFLRGRGLHPIAAFDVDRDQLAFMGAGFVPHGMPVGYVCDFLFVPRRA